MLRALRSWAWSVAVGALLAGAAAAQPAAPDPLADVAAEARERQRARTPTSQPWRTLTRERLVQLLQGDELARIPRFEGLGPLIDQAGAWDLLRFDKPSDVRAQWWRWSRPQDRTLVDPAAARPSLPSSGFGLVADAGYSDEAGAFVALWNCLPPAAWQVAHQHPMLWALEQGQIWDVPNDFDFGSCVRRQPEGTGVPPPPGTDTARGQRSARVIADRLVGHLRRSGCSGSGPDDCLVVLHALLSLAPTRAELPGLAAAVLDHHRRQLGELPPRPPVPSARAGQLDPAGQALVLAARRDLMHRVLLLDLALQLQRAHPGTAAPAPPEALTEVQALVGRQLELDQLQGTHNLPRLRATGHWAPPWRALQRLVDTDARWLGAQRDAVKALAEAGGCGRIGALADGHAGWPDADGWLLVAAQRLRQGLPDCRTLDLAALATGYADAATWQARSSRPLAAAGLQGLQVLLGDEAHSSAHVQLLRTLGTACPQAHDPWQACHWFGAEQRRLGGPLARLPVRPADRFVARVLWDPATTAWPDPAVRLLKALQRRALARHPDAAQAVGRALQPLQRLGEVDVGRLWRHPRHPLAAVEIRLAPSSDAPADALAALGALRHLLLIDRHDAWLLPMPGGWGQYDDGEVAAVTDIDGDRRLEVWAGGTFGECDGEDARPGRNCSLFRIHLAGEVFGRHLAPYLPGPPR